MAYQTENTLEKREARVAAAMRFEEGDRVPFAPRMGTVYSELAGMYHPLHPCQTSCKYNATRMTCPRP